MSPDPGERTGPAGADSLVEVRSQIDRLDRELVSVIAAREQLVLRAGRLKGAEDAVRAPGRVEEVVGRARAAAEELGACPDVVERTSRAMVAASVDRELAATGMTEERVEGVRLERATPEDAGEVLTLQRAAYATEAVLYGDPGLPAMVQTLDDLRVELASGVALKAVLRSRTVGAVRARVRASVLHVGRLTVAPDHQGHGIGSMLLAAVERAAGPDVRSATLFTGHLSAGNLEMYARRGYVEERREQLRPGVVLVHLTKQLPAG